MSSNVQPLYYNVANSKYYYTDVNLDYTVNSGQLLLLGVDAVVNAFANLIRTSPGEMWFEPTFGSGVMDLLFDQTIPSKALRIFNRAYEACDQWMPMVKVNKSGCSLQMNTQVGSTRLQFALVLNESTPITLGIIVTGVS